MPMEFGQRFFQNRLYWRLSKCWELDYLDILNYIIVLSDRATLKT
jgi:hypothetical protein